MEENWDKSNSLTCSSEVVGLRKPTTLRLPPAMSANLKPGTYVACFRISGWKRDSSINGTLEKNWCKLLTGASVNTLSSPCWHILNASKELFGLDEWVLGFNVSVVAWTYAGCENCSFYCTEVIVDHKVIVKGSRLK